MIRLSSHVLNAVATVPDHTNPDTNYRFNITNKRQSKTTSSRENKRARMETSTPLKLRYRNTVVIPSSPINRMDDSLSVLTISSDDSNATSVNTGANTTNKMDGLNLTAPEEESPVTRNAKTFVDAHNHIDSLESFRKRTTSLPLPRKLIMDGTLRELNRSKSCGDLMDSDAVVGVIIKEPAAASSIQMKENEDPDMADVAVGQSIEGHTVTEGAVEIGVQEVTGAGVEVNIQEPSVMMGKNVQEPPPVPADVVGVDQGELSDEDNERMINMMREKMENKLYPIFRRKDKWERGVILRKNAVAHSARSSQVKRKNSSRDTNDSGEWNDSPKLRSIRRNTFGSPSSVARIPARKRTKSLVVMDSRQSLITDLMAVSMCQSTSGQS